MDDNVRDGVHRVAEGESVNDVLHALVSEVRLGDPDELERLYGGDFSPTGKLDFSAHSEGELDNVPAFVRQSLVHHGYRHQRSDCRGNFGDLHIYSHPQGHVVHIMATDTRMHWAHSTNGVQTHQSHRGGENLVNYLDKYHS